MLAALGMIVLLMMAGLGVDVGYLKYQKQQMQKAADAGALAAATALIYYGTGNQAQINAAGQADTTVNGYQNGHNGVTVQVNNPPITNGDPFQGNNNYVEVVVSQARPTFFMRLAGYSSVNVSSRAVATSVSSASGCIYALSPSLANALRLLPGTGGQPTQISSNCEILVASDAFSALRIANGDTIVTTSNIGVVGPGQDRGCEGTDCDTLQTDGELTTGIAPFTDPLANLPSPAVPPGCQFTGKTVNTNLGPQQLDGNATYCGGITVQGNGSVTFAPGMYYLVGGGLQIQAGNNPNLSGNGVTFYNTYNNSINGGAYAPVNIAGSTTGSLAAPDTGNFAGILFFQDRSVTYNPAAPNYINGAGGALYTGTLYFPTTALTYNGAQVTDPYELIIGWTLTFSGDTTIANSYSSLPNGASPIANAALVE